MQYTEKKKKIKKYNYFLYDFVWNCITINLVFRLDMFTCTSYLKDTFVNMLVLTVIIICTIMQQTRK